MTPPSKCQSRSRTVSRRRRWTRRPARSLELIDVTQSATLLAGGQGLVSTAGHYLRFAQMSANGGELEGVRILSPRTIAFMASDHLPGAGVERGTNWIPGYGYRDFAVRRETGEST